MTARERMHRLIDTLPEDATDDALAALEEIVRVGKDNEVEAALTPEEEALIEEGIDDVRGGRVRPWFEVRRELGI